MKRNKGSSLLENIIGILVTIYFVWAIIPEDIYNKITNLFPQTEQVIEYDGQNK